MYLHPPLAPLFQRLLALLALLVCLFLMLVSPNAYSQDAALQEKPPCFIVLTVITVRTVDGVDTTTSRSVGPVEHKGQCGPFDRTAIWRLAPWAEEADFIMISPQEEPAG